MSHEFTLELVDGQILLDGRAVATLIPSLPFVIEQELREALEHDVESEIDEARTEARDEAFRDVAKGNEDALSEVQDWKIALGKKE
jgi:hypothetical protein